MSPTAAITTCFGRASFTPIAIGSPAPTEPQSLMYMKVCGS